MSNTITLTETRTDAATVTFFGPVALAEFTWSGPTTDTSHLLVSTAELTSALDDTGEGPVSVVAGLRDHVLVTDAGVERLAEHGALFLFGEPSGPTGPLFFDAHTDPTGLRAALEVTPGEALTSRVFHLDPSHGVWRLDAADVDGPALFPVKLRLNSDTVDLAAAAAHLDSLSAVRTLQLTTGRDIPGGHIADRLTAVVDLTAEQWARMCTYAAERYGHVRGGAGRPPAPSFAMIEGLLAAAVRGTDDPLGDPLGLAPFARTD